VKFNLFYSLFPIVFKLIHIFLHNGIKIVFGALVEDMLQELSKLHDIRLLLNPRFI